MKLKNLLHLYNDGHEPFGKGGLGYHPIRMYGDGFIIDEDELFWDGDDADKTVKYYVNGRLMKKTPQINSELYDTLKESYGNTESTKEDFDAIIKDVVEDIPETMSIEGTKSLKSASGDNQPIVPLTFNDLKIIDNRGKVNTDNIPDDYKDCFKIAREYIFENPFDAEGISRLLTDDDNELIRLNEGTKNKQPKAYIKADLRFIVAVSNKFPDMSQKYKQKFIELAQKLIHKHNVLTRTESKGKLFLQDDDGKIGIYEQQTEAPIGKTTEEPYKKISTKESNKYIDRERDEGVDELNTIIDEAIDDGDHSKAINFEYALVQRAPELFGCSVENSKDFIKDMYDTKVKPVLDKLKLYIESGKDESYIRSKLQIPDDVLIPKSSKALNIPESIMENSYCHDALSIEGQSKIIEFKYYNNIDIEYLIKKNEELKAEYREELLLKGITIDDPIEFNKSFYKNKPYMGIPLTLNKLTKQRQSYLKIKEGDTKFRMHSKLKARHAIGRIEHGVYEPSMTMNNINSFITDTKYNRRTDIVGYFVNKELHKKFEGKEYEFLMTVKGKTTISTYNLSRDPYINDISKIFKVYQASHIYDSYTGYTDADFKAVLIPAEHFIHNKI